MHCCASYTLRITPRRNVCVDGIVGVRGLPAHTGNPNDFGVHTRVPTRFHHRKTRVFGYLAGYPGKRHSYTGHTQTQYTEHSTYSTQQTHRLLNLTFCTHARQAQLQSCPGPLPNEPQHWISLTQFKHEHSLSSLTSSRRSSGTHALLPVAAVVVPLFSLLL